MLAAENVFCSNTAFVNHLKSREHAELAQRLGADPDELNKFPAMPDFTMIDSTTAKGFHTSTQLHAARQAEYARQKLPRLYEGDEGVFISSTAVKRRYENSIPCDRDIQIGS